MCVPVESIRVPEAALVDRLLVVRRTESTVLGDHAEGNSLDIVDPSQYEIAGRKRKEEGADIRAATPAGRGTKQECLAVPQDCGACRWRALRSPAGNATTVVSCSHPNFEHLLLRPANMIIRSLIAWEALCSDVPSPAPQGGNLSVPSFAPQSSFMTGTPPSPYRITQCAREILHAISVHRNLQRFPDSQGGTLRIGSRAHCSLLGHSR